MGFPLLRERYKFDFGGVGEGEEEDNREPQSKSF